MTECDLLNLRESPHKSLCMLVVSEADGFGPVVCPLDHGAWLEVVAPQLVQVATTVFHLASHSYFRPITEIIVIFSANYYF